MVGDESVAPPLAHLFPTKLLSVYVLTVAVICSVLGIQIMTKIDKIIIIITSMY